MRPACHSRPKKAVVGSGRVTGNARSLLSAFVLAGFAIAGGAPALAKTTGDLPRLRAGLWEASTTFPGRPQARPLLTRLCIDGQTQRQLLERAALAMLPMCSRNDFGMHGGRFVTDSSCTIAGSTVEGRTETTFFGDTSYHTEVMGRVSPPGRVVASQKTIIDSRHVGKCPAGMKAGDMTLPNGLRFNLLQATSSALTK